MPIHGYTGPQDEVFVELDFLDKPRAFFEALDPADPVMADLLTLCQEIADTQPPTSYPRIQRLKGDKSLRGVFYARYYGRGRSIRLYFMAGRGRLLLIHVIGNKRRTKLTKGEIEAIGNAAAKGRERLDERK